MATNLLIQHHGRFITATTYIKVAPYIASNNCVLVENTLLLLDYTVKPFTLIIAPTPTAAQLATGNVMY
jgi:hypothetical protein